MFYSGKKEVFLHFICFHFIWSGYLWKRNSFCFCVQYCLGFPQQCWGSRLSPGHMTYLCFSHWLLISLKTEESLVTLAVSILPRWVGKWAKGPTWWNISSVENDCKVSHIKHENVRRAGNHFPEKEAFLL